MRIGLSRLKKFFALGLIIGSTVFAVLIISDHPKSIPTDSYQVSQVIQSEKLPDTLPVDAKNLTEEAAKKIGDQISSLQDQKNLDPEKVARNYLAESAKDFDYRALKAPVAVNRLKIVSSLDRRLLAIYEKALNDALNSSFVNLKLAGSDPQVAVGILAQAYGKAIETLYQMPIPEVFGSLHEKLIANLGGQKSAAEIILNNSQSDPLRALFALQAITKLNEELGALQRAISNLASRNS